MQTNLNALRTEINELVSELNESMVDIANLDTFIESIDDPESETLMMEVMMKKADTFEEIAETTRRKIQNYLNEQKVQAIPTDFTLVRFLNQISKD